MTDETAHITPTIPEANLHRAVPRQPVEHRHFTPQKAPWSVRLIGYVGCCCYAVGMLGIAVGFGAMLRIGPSAGAHGLVTVGVASIAAGAICVAGYHVAKAVIDIRDMMRHRGG